MHPQKPTKLHICPSEGKKEIKDYKQMHCRQITFHPLSPNLNVNNRTRYLSRLHRACRLHVLALPVERFITSSHGQIDKTKNGRQAGRQAERQAHLWKRSKRVLDPGGHLITSGWSLSGSSGGNAQQGAPQHRVIYIRPRHSQC